MNLFCQEPPVHALLLRSVAQMNAVVLEHARKSTSSSRHSAPRLTTRDCTSEFPTLEDLEALVEAEQETAVEELEAEEADESEKTVDEIVKELADEVSEETSAVVEQQQDPESFLSTSYTIGVEYGGETRNSYYESLKDAESTGSGAVYEAVIEQEGKSLELGQEINEYAREDKMLNRTTFVVDPESRDARDQIKLFNPALRQMMYDGKITFN